MRAAESDQSAFDEPPTLSDVAWTEPVTVRLQTQAAMG